MECFELYIADPPKSKSHKGMFKKNGIRKYLRPFEVQEIIRLYSDSFNWQLAKNFNVSESAINNIRRKYGLKKSQSIMDAGRFPQGHKPHNKGKPHIFPPNSGQFPKGHIPKNHRELFSLRLQKHNDRGEQYLYIKVAEPNKWKPLHRYIWENKYGPVPKGKILIFIDGDIFNTDILNLKLISRSENMERNRNRRKAADSMRKLWRKEKLRDLYGLERKTNLRVKSVFVN